VVNIPELMVDLVLILILVHHQLHKAYLLLVEVVVELIPMPVVTVEVVVEQHVNRPLLLVEQEILLHTLHRKEKMVEHQHHIILRTLLVAVAVVPVLLEHQMMVSQHNLQIKERRSY